jgi:HEAT repeat protein
MYEDDELTVVDLDADLADPLDQIEVAEQAAGVVTYDPEEMLPLLTAPEAQQRMLAARAFCEIEDVRAIPSLIQLLKDNCPLVRVSATYALGRNMAPEAIAPLIAQLKDWNGFVRKGAVWALGNSRHPEVIAPLAHALKTDIPAVRLWAASALAQMATLGYKSIIVALPTLIAVMRHDDIAAVRSNSAWALGQLCKELPSNVIYGTAIDALIETFAEDEDLGVREDARTAILGLGDARGLQIIEELEQDGWF